MHAWLLLVALGSAQTSHTSGGLPDCTNARPGQACAILIDRLAPVSGTTVRVENRTAVRVVLIRKSPFESCKNEVKREELPDVSAIPTLLGMVKDLAGGVLFPSAAVSPEAVRRPADDVSQRLDAVRKFADEQSDAAAQLQQSYDAELKALKAFYATRYLHTPYADADHPDEYAFEQARAARQHAVEDLVKRPIPNTAGGEVAYKALLTAFSAYVRSSGATPADIGMLEESVNRARSALDALGKAVGELRTAHDKLQSTVEYLEQLQNPEWIASIPLRADNNAKLTGSFACTSDISGKPTLDPPVVYTVSFQNTPRLSLTAGILLSTIRRNSIALESVADDRTGSAVTVHTEIRDHPSRPQVVPFSFINIRLAAPRRWHGRTITLNATPGLGLNPNNGGPSSEFFAGAAVGIDSLFIALGAHIGHELRPANGFQIHDRPPDDLTAAPTETPWKPGVGFSVSYRIPLK